MFDSSKIKALQDAVSEIRVALATANAGGPPEGLATYTTRQFFFHSGIVGRLTRIEEQLAEAQEACDKKFAALEAHLGITLEFKPKDCKEAHYIAKKAK